MVHIFKFFTLLNLNKYVYNIFIVYIIHIVNQTKIPSVHCKILLQFYNNQFLSKTLLHTWYLIHYISHSLLTAFYSYWLLRTRHTHTHTYRGWQRCSQNMQLQGHLLQWKTTPDVGTCIVPDNPRLIGSAIV